MYSFFHYQVLDKLASNDGFILRPIEQLKLSNIESRFDCTINGKKIGY